MPAPTILGTAAEMFDRWGELKELMSACATAGDAAELLERHARSAYPELPLAQAVERVLCEAADPLVRGIYERGRVERIAELQREQAETAADVAAVLNPKDDVLKQEKKNMTWVPGRAEAERAAYELYRKASYNNAEAIARDRKVEKRAEDFDSVLMGLAELCSRADNIPVHEAATTILKGSRALALARVAALRGARVPGAVRCLNAAYRRAAGAPSGQAVRAAAAVVGRFDSGPPED